LEEKMKREKRKMGKITIERGKTKVKLKGKR
jgi:hypothetical protein